MISEALSHVSSPAEVVEGPSIAIVIPVYKHSGLVTEALRSAFDQSAPSESYHVVLLNDGCPYASTHHIGLASALSAKPNFTYLRQTNKGLSAARNAGIRYALRRFPTLAAVYLLDADNRLSRDTVANCIDALADYPEKDWFYPNVVTIGHRMSASMAGPYSQVQHTQLNYCEAGSLIRTRVFTAGIFFDENMKLGYEDWEFWLAAVEKGFRGQHLPSINYRYRRRPESMLADSDRDDSEIKAYMGRKHPWMKNPQHMVALAEQEAYHFAIVTETGVYLTNDPTSLGNCVSHTTFVSNLTAHTLRPSEISFPKIVVHVTEAQISEAKNQKVLRWIFWQLERETDKQPYSAINTRPGQPGRLRLTNTPSAPADGADSLARWGAVRSSTLRSVLLDVSMDWFESVLRDTQLKNDTLSLEWETSPTAQFNDARPQECFRELVRLAQGEIRQTGDPFAPSIHTDICPRDSIFDLACRPINGGPVFPLQQSGKEKTKRIAFVLPIVDFGGVERVAFQVAAELKEDDTSVHLFCFSAKDVFLPDEFKDVFEDIAWLPSPSLLGWTGSEYVSTRMCVWDENALPRAHAVGILALFDVVINCHSPDFHLIAGELKRMGIRLFDYQHLVEWDKNGRPIGHPFLDIAYNHVYEATIACSTKLTRWLHAQGIPTEKLITVTNGPGFSIPEQIADAAVFERRQRHKSGIGPSNPLRVAYFGRLDYQKGIDRLDAIYLRTTHNPKIAWRICGKTILSDQENNNPSFSIEPPMYAAQQLTELLQWADVFVLPSRFEGLPLSVIEAMSMGVIVITTDVGAIQELITSPREGFIFPEDTFIQEAVDCLNLLITDPNEMDKISSLAYCRSQNMKWNRNVRPLLDRLQVAASPTVIGIPSGQSADPASCESSSLTSTL